MKLVADHDHAGPKIAPDRLDLPVESGRSRLVEALCRLIEQQEVRLVEDRPGQQDPLHLPTGQGRHLALFHATNACVFERCLGCSVVCSMRKVQKPADRHRKGNVEVQLLRNVSDLKPGHPADLCAAGVDRADHSAQESGLARSVRADNRHDLPAINAKGHIVEDRFLAITNVQPVDVDQAHSMRSAQFGQTPSASITVSSISNPAFRAASARRPFPAGESASATAPQTRQIRKAG